MRGRRAITRVSELAPCTGFPLNCRTPPLLGASGHGHYDTTRHVHTRLSNVYTARPRPPPFRVNLQSGSVSCSPFGRRPTASAVVSDVSSSGAVPPPHLRRLAPLAPREPTARVGPPLIPLTPPPTTPFPTPWARTAALGRVASPPREDGPALPGRRVARTWSIGALALGALGFQVKFF